MPTIQIPSEYKGLFGDYREAAVYGGRASLKSHTVARYLLIRATQDKTRILCAREYQNSIADSSMQLLADLIEQYGLSYFTVTRDSIVNTVNGSDFLFKGLHNNIQSIKSIEGVDIAWIEESQTVSEQSIDVLTPTVRKAGSKLIYTYNRLRENDPVHKRLVLEGRKNTLVLNVNYDVALKYGFMSQALIDEMEDDKLNRPQLYNHKWLGEPIDESDMSLISRESLSIAFKPKDMALLPTTELGADIARYGGDRTVIVIRNGNKVVYAKILQNKDTQTVAREIETLADRYNSTVIKVDETGVGGGVIDAIRINREVIGINFGGKPQDATKYTNWISEAWFNLSDNIEDIDLSWFNGRTDFAGLADELSMREWKVGQAGKSSVQSKEEFKKSFGKSPDIADALLICFNDKPRVQWASADDLL